MYFFRKGWLGGQLGQTKKHMSQKKKKQGLGEKKWRMTGKKEMRWGYPNLTKNYIKESMGKWGGSFLDKEIIVLFVYLQDLT